MEEKREGETDKKNVKIDKGVGGRGLFATRPLEPMQRILVERPLTWQRRPPASPSPSTTSTAGHVTNLLLPTLVNDHETNGGHPATGSPPKSTAADFECESCLRVLGPWSAFLNALGARLNVKRMPPSDAIQQLVTRLPPLPEARRCSRCTASFCSEACENDPFHHATCQRLEQFTEFAQAASAVTAIAKLEMYARLSVELLSRVRCEERSLDEIIDDTLGPMACTLWTSYFGHGVETVFPFREVAETPLIEGALSFYEEKILPAIALLKPLIDPHDEWPRLFTPSFVNKVLGCASFN